MRILFIYPSFERHAQSHPELLSCVPCNEYIGSPSLGIAAVAACTPAEFDVAFVDDRIHPVDEQLPEADLYALSFFTPAATRAFEIAKLIRSTGKPVVAGGIFPSMMPKVVSKYFDSVVVGEGEPVWAQLCQDAADGRLKPRYESDSAADLDSLPTPRIDLYISAEDESFSPDDYPLQTSRGCPFNCDACVLPVCMGKKIRHFPDKYVFDLLDRFGQASKRCCLTEDTSFIFVSGARRRFRRLLKHLAERQTSQPVKLSYLGTSMPLLLNIEDEIFDEVRAAGVSRFYLVGGFDPITRGAFGTGDKAMLEKARTCVRRCQDHGVEPYVSFLVGNQDDDQGTFERMLEFANQVELNIAEFAIATPYPGTPLWSRLEEEDRIFDRTWKHYNDSNVVFHPYKMSAEKLLEGYLFLWREFYSSRQHLSQAAAELNTVQF
ncbi:MAG: B12-binding domain-containing radical SAM protein [Deltaproteobacteria bacterium]|nr:B12-binding domain-containing radical SAM protein [Deltaproteobacteria bacterium]